MRHARQFDVVQVLALALHQRRIACTIYESVTELRPLGVEFRHTAEE